MKYYKITINKGKGGLMIYPPNYQDEVGDKAVDHLYWDEGQQTYLILCIPDKEANIVREGIEEITEADAKTISDANETRVEKIVDPVKLRRIELKAQLAQPLTADEQDAIDINHPDSVFALTETLSDRIDTIK